MTTNVLQPRASDEDLLKSLEWFDFSNFRIEGDTLDTERLVNLLYVSYLTEATNTAVNWLLSWDYSIEKIWEIQSLFEQILIKSRCVDRMFNEPPREEMDDDELSNEVIPSIVVYKDWKLFWANKSYLRNIWINSLSQVKERAAINYEDWVEIIDWIEVPIIRNWLVEDIYDWSRKSKVYNRTKILKNNLWYEWEFFQPTLPTWEINTILFSSHWINNWTWSVRIWMNITSEVIWMTEEEIEEHIKSHYKVGEDFYTPDFWFVNNITELKNKLKFFLQSTKFDTWFYETLDNLFFRAEIADLIFSKTPYAMNLYKWPELILANKYYIDLAWKWFFEMVKLSKEWKLINELFWDWVEAETVRQSVWTLKKFWHYFKQFSFVTTNKIADFDTFDVWSWYTFRIWKKDVESEKYFKDIL